MNNDYIITNEELDQEYGLDLDDYAIDGTLVTVIIKMALGLGITRILKLNDNFNGESDIESALDNDTTKVSAFKKMQYRIIYNLLFVADSDPLDNSVDDIVVYDLKWGKINGFQKGVYRQW